MEFPSSLKYTKDHEWIEQAAKVAKIGVTAYAIEQLGDIVHVDDAERTATKGYKRFVI